ncbi:MAG: hypothetical protein ACYC3S_08865 [Chloroflexota bacterium]
MHHMVPAKRTTWRYFLFRNFYEGRSKARIAKLVGQQDGLEVERQYALRTLPRGVGRSARDFVILRDINGLSKATAIGVGLAAAAVGYLAGSLSGKPVMNPRVRVQPGKAAGGQLP